VLEVILESLLKTGIVLGTHYFLGELVEEGLEGG
jgi:hypothetical protein